MALAVDVSFFKPFVEGTIKTLKVQCSLDAKPGKPLFKGTAPRPDFDIAAVIGILSSSFTGTISLCFPKAVFLTIMNNMLGENNAEITGELEDGAGELLNIIFGHAKSVLNAQGHDIQKAIPTIVRGSGLETRHLTPSKVVVLPFLTPAGEFDIEIGIEGKGI